MKKTDILEFGGEAHTVEEWAERKGMTLECLRHRLNRGMSIEEALNTPSRRKPSIRPTEPRADRNCRDCIYTEVVTLPGDGRWNICDYMGRMENKRRPCPYGDGCTVKKKKEDMA